MAVLVRTKDLDREEWLRWRTRGIGGSDAAAICGLNPWKSPAAVWLEKTGEVEPKEDFNEAAYWGGVLEGVVAEEFARRTGLRIRRSNFMLVHETRPWMIANLDRIVYEDGEPGVLEIKTTGEYRKDLWSEGRIPDYYMIQLQHYLAVTGYRFGHFAVLIGGQKFVQSRVERDEEIIAHLEAIEEDFWQKVQSRTLPEMDGSESSSRVLSLLFPQSRPGEVVQLPPEAADLIREYETASANEKAAAEAREAAANRLKAYLGESEAGICGDRKVQWKTVTSERLDARELRAKAPEIYSQFAREIVYRRFDVR